MKPKPPDDLWKKLDEECNKRFGGPPPGSFTLREFCERRNLMYEIGRNQVKRLVQAGIVERLGKFGEKGALHYRVK